MYLQVNVTKKLGIIIVFYLFYTKLCCQVDSIKNVYKPNSIYTIKYKKEKFISYVSQYKYYIYTRLGIL